MFILLYFIVGFVIALMTYIHSWADIKDDPKLDIVLIYLLILTLYPILIFAFIQQKKFWLFKEVM